MCDIRSKAIEKRNYRFVIILMIRTAILFRKIDVKSSVPEIYTDRTINITYTYKWVWQHDDILCNIYYIVEQIYLRDHSLVMFHLTAFEI